MWENYCSSIWRKCCFQFSMSWNVKHFPFNCEVIDEKDVRSKYEERAAAYSILKLPNSNPDTTLKFKFWWIIFSKGEVLTNPQICKQYLSRMDCVQKNKTIRHFLVKKKVLLNKNTTKYVW